MPAVLITQPAPTRLLGTVGATRLEDGERACEVSPRGLLGPSLHRPTGPHRARSGVPEGAAEPGGQASDWAPGGNHGTVAGEQPEDGGGRGADDGGRSSGVTTVTEGVHLGGMLYAVVVGAEEALEMLGLVLFLGAVSVTLRRTRLTAVPAAHGEDLRTPSA